MQCNADSSFSPREVIRPQHRHCASPENPELSVPGQITLDTLRKHSVGAEDSNVHRLDKGCSHDRAGHSPKDLETLAPLDRSEHMLACACGPGGQEHPSSALPLACLGRSGWARHRRAHSATCAAWQLPCRNSPAGPGGHRLGETRDGVMRGSASHLCSMPTALQAPDASFSSHMLC